MASSFNILDTDDSNTTEEHPTLKWLRRFARGLEIGLWTFKMVALFFFLESWEGSNELMIASTGALILFYLFLTFWVAGAKGWYQVMGSEITGVALTFLMMGRLFIIQSWEGGREVKLMGLVLSIVVAVAASSFWFWARKKQQPLSFYQNILIRLAVVSLIG